MMSIGTIRRFSREAAQIAAKENKVPLLVEEEDLERIKDHLRYMPFVGDYVPTDYKLVETYFVDMTGVDETGPALSQKKFFSKVKTGRGYAVVEAGQLQMYVGEFVKK